MNRLGRAPGSASFRSTWRARAIGAAICLSASLTLLNPAPNAAARTEEAETYAQSADQLLKKGDLRGAVIQLRNAIQKSPEDGDLRIKLGRVYLLLGDPIGAEAAAVAAKERGIPEEQIAPLLAEALFQQGEFGRLLKAVPAGDRPAAVESVVRTLRGLAFMALGEDSNAEPMLRDALNLDPAAIGPKIAMVDWLLRKGKIADAEQQAEAALKIAPDSSQAAVAKGVVLIAKGDSAGALDTLNGAINRDPNNLRARLLRANIFVQRSDLEDAQKDLDVVIARAPKSVQANYLQALIFARKGEMARADETLGKISGNFGDVVAAYYLAGAVKFRLGQLDLATDYLARYVARQPNSSSGYKMLGVVLLRKRDSKGAIDALEKAASLAPGDVEAVSLLSQAYQAHGDVEKAFAVLEAASTQQPENLALQTQVAVARFNRGETTEGLAELERIFRADPKAPGAGATYVLSALRANENEKAIVAAEDLVRQDPESKPYQYLLGIARFANQDYAGAEKIFRILLDKNPDSAPARRNLVQVYLAMHRDDDAKRLLGETLKKNSSDIDSMIALANINFSEANPDEAIKYLTQAQTASKDDPTPGLRLVTYYESKKDWSLALAAAKDLLAHFQDNANVADALARVQIESGDGAAGLATYQHAVDAVPNSVGLLQRYASALLAAKDYTKAREMLKRALVLAPDNDQTKRLIVVTEYRAGGPDAAIAAARTFTAADSRNPIGEILVAEVFVENGKGSEAVALLKNTLAKNPSTKVVLALAGLESRIGDKTAAAAVLEEWVSAHADDVPARIGLAQAYLAIRDYDAAQREYEWLARARESDPVILNNLAWVYQQKSDPRARAMAEKAYRIAPVPSIADTLGWILVLRGENDAAMTFLRQATDASPANPAMQYHLAVALQRSGNVDAARGILQKIVKSDADFDGKSDAQALLAQIGGG